MGWSRNAMQTNEKWWANRLKFLSDLLHKPFSPPLVPSQTPHSHLLRRIYTRECACGRKRKFQVDLLVCRRVRLSLPVALASSTATPGALKPTNSMDVNIYHFMSYFYIFIKLIFDYGNYFLIKLNTSSLYRWRHLRDSK